ncbi:MAG: phospholipid carrier-dependent glycosyltransferase [Anaerolineales bacterium]|nr:phospholipid carrier-dependent glycosyltransferase [Anaerolineales bacterium]
MLVQKGGILAAGLAAAVYLGFLLGSLPAVPFHPDEATYIYMSRDLDRILESGPLSVCWRKGNAADLLQTERERDTPLTRYTVGAARRIGGKEATAANWDWSAEWSRNLERGAVPSPGLLFLARIPQAGLLFLAVLLMARIGWRLGGGTGAAAAALLFGLNPQILLHGRRAMSEAGLLFGMILTVALLLERRRIAARFFREIGWPLSVGAALALSASAKYSGLLIAPVVLAAMFLETGEESVWRVFLRGLARSGVTAAGFLAVFLLLNPVYWCDPLGALAATVAERQCLLAEQVQALRAAAPMSLLESVPIRLMGAFYEWFVAPPAFWEIPNYADATAAAERAYLALPLNALTAGAAGSGLAAGLALYGLGYAGVRVVRRRLDGAWIVALLWFLSVFAGIIAGIPILWQRYYLPLIPAGAALSAGAVGAVAAGIGREIRKRREPSRDNRVG